MEKYSTQFKLSVVNDVLKNDTSLGDASTKYNIDRTTIRNWVKRYQSHGISGISKHYKHYTGQFKQEVVEFMRANNLSFRETAVKFNLSHDVIIRWEEIYLREGPEGLYLERRGGSKPNTIEKKDHSPTGNGLKDLIAENQRLRMENDYLKKLNALVREREISEKKKRPR